MKKKIIANFMASLLALTAVAGLAAGCSNDLIGEEIDETKTQLYVYNFAGGYGSDWLAAAKTRFEALHANDIWEDGKQGVQIIMNPQKSNIMSLSGQILDNRDEIYFTEYAYYYSLKADGVLGDITDAVTKPLTEFGENKTILDKLTTEQKAYYAIENNGETKYYALPHYAGYFNIIYNVDLFDAEGLYFAKTPSDSTLEGRFIDQYNTEKSVGPDGQAGTSDDGLPRTYEEFFYLCDYVAFIGMTPLTWTGQYYRDYLDGLLQAMVADHAGLDEMTRNYTLTGESTSLANIVNGALVKDTTPTAIDDDVNGYELARQEAKYYGLKFLEKILDTDKYTHELTFNGGYSHMNAQEDFLYGGHDGVTKPIAMLIEGSHWLMEADSTFTDMVETKGEQFSKYNRNFAVMPMPKATEARATEYANSDVKNTLCDYINSICFMKANVAEWKKPLALDFIRFVNSDESLIEYTKITSTLKALEYEITDSDMIDFTPYAKSVVAMRKQSNVVYPFSTNSVYMNNESVFSYHNLYKSKVGDKVYANAPAAFHENPSLTAEDYFSGMYGQFKTIWSSLG